MADPAPTQWPALCRSRIILIQTKSACLSAYLCLHCLVVFLLILLAQRAWGRNVTMKGAVGGHLVVSCLDVLRPNTQGIHWHLLLSFELYRESSNRTSTSLPQTSSGTECVVSADSAEMTHPFVWSRGSSSAIWSDLGPNLRNRI